MNVIIGLQYFKMSRNLFELNPSLEGISGISRIVTSNDSFIYQEQTNQDLFYKIKVNTPQGHIKQSPQLKEPAHKHSFHTEITGFDINRQIYSDEEIREAFNTIDINKDGLLTHDDISFFLKCMGQAHSKEEVDEMIKMVSSNSDKVLLQDFRKIGKGLLIPIASIKLPELEIKSKEQRINNIKQSHIYNLTPKEVLQYQSKQNFSQQDYKQQKQSKSLEREVRNEEKKDKNEINFIVFRLTSEIQNKRKQMMSLSIDNVQNIIHKLSSYHKEQLELKDLVSLLNINDAKARTIFFDKSPTLHYKQLILDAILFSRKPTLERFEQILMNYSKGESLSYEQWKNILVYMMGLQEKQLVEKRLNNLLRYKKLNTMSFFDKYFILNIMNEEFSLFNW